MSLILLSVLFACTACIYAIAGFGGGSTYLALMALFSVPYQTMPKVALLCNMVVVAGGLLHFSRSGLAQFRSLFPFLLSSIPFAYLGGSLAVSKQVFLVLLSFSLCCAALRMFWTEKNFEQAPVLPQQRLPLSLLLGALIGLLSGIVGIGGGIFLAPILYVLRWEKPRVIAAQSSLFIFLNSLSGLYGQLQKGSFTLEWNWLLPLMFAVFVGGQLGSMMSCSWLKEIKLRYVTAALILFVAARLMWSLL